VTEGCELDNFGTGDSVQSDFWAQISLKYENFWSGIRRTTIYGNFLMIAEE
jgi:hypothetical protein